MIGTLETRVTAWLAAATQGDWDVAHRIAALMPPAEYAALREAVIERDEELRVPDCPECLQRKCGNCDGTTWDPDLDDLARCPCAHRGHTPKPAPPDGAASHWTGADSEQ